jgi:hypothetical protein
MMFSCEDNLRRMFLRRSDIKVGRLIAHMRPAVTLSEVTQTPKIRRRN